MVRTLLYIYTANADFPRASVCSTKRSFETRRSEWTRAEMGMEDTWQHAYHRPEHIPWPCTHYPLSFLPKTRW